MRCWARRRKRRWRRTKDDVCLCHQQGLEMRRRRSLFPSWRRYLFCLLPGSLLALTGIVVNFSVTDMSQYQYSHSFWHFALMLAPCFLIPPRPKDIYGEGSYSSVAHLYIESREGILFCFLFFCFFAYFSFFPFYSGWNFFVGRYIETLKCYIVLI